MMTRRCGALAEVDDVDDVDGAQAAKVSVTNTNKSTFMASVYLILLWLEGYLYIHCTFSECLVSVRQAKTPNLS